MHTYIWLFPLLFIFHDMEEIIGIIPWLHRNHKFLSEKYPAITRAIMKQYGQASTEGFALAVFEELLLCILLCLISLVIDW